MMECDVDGQRRKVGNVKRDLDADAEDGVRGES
jgi:hypothetical protein